MKQNTFYTFIKSPQAPVFALATMILTFFQMYAKLFYYHNSYETGIQAIDIFVSLVAAGGLSTMTFIIIIHSKKKWMPLFFAGLDFVGGLLFYGKDIVLLYETAKYVEIGSALFIPFFKAASIYFVGEIFLEEVSNEMRQVSSENETLTLANLEIQNTKQELSRAKSQLISAQQQHTELGNQVSQLSQQLTASKKSVSDREASLLATLENLKAEKQQTEQAFRKFKDDSVEWRRAYLETEITRIKRDGNWQQRADKVQAYQELTEQLQELNA